MGSEIVPIEGKLANAADVVGFVCDNTGIIMPPQWRSTLGKMAKAMLAEKIPVDIVNAACYMAVLRGKPYLAQYIAGDLMLAASGERMDEREYQTKLAMYSAQHNGSRSLLDEQRERRDEIKRRRQT